MKSRFTYFVALISSNSILASLCQSAFSGGSDIQDAYQRRSKPRPRSGSPFRWQQEAGDIDIATAVGDNATISAGEYSAALLLGHMNTLWSEYVELKLRLEGLGDTIEAKEKAELADKISVGLSNISSMLGELSKELTSDTAFDDSEEQSKLAGYADDLATWRHNFIVLSASLDDKITTGGDTGGDSSTDIPAEGDGVTRLVQDSEESIPEPLINDLDTGNDSFLEVEEVPDPDDDDDLIDGDETGEGPIVPNSGVLSSSGMDAENAVEKQLLEMDERGETMEVTPDIEDDDDIESNIPRSNQDETNHLEVATEDDANQEARSTEEKKKSPVGEDPANDGGSSGGSSGGGSSGGGSSGGGSSGGTDQKTSGFNELSITVATTMSLLSIILFGFF